MLPAIILFSVTYVLMLIFGKYRPYIALASGVIFILSGMLPFGNVLGELDFNVLLIASLYPIFSILATSDELVQGGKDQSLLRFKYIGFASPYHYDAAMSNFRACSYLYQWRLL